MDSTPRVFDPFAAQGELDSPFGKLTIWRLERLEQLGLVRLEELPYSIRVLLENVLRNCDGQTISEEDVHKVAAWKENAGKVEIPFMPGRVILQDFTGVPALVDLAAMRDAMKELGGDPALVNPLIPVDLVIDHSIQVDHYGDQSALARNMDLEYERNAERYRFLRWGEKAFKNFRIIPPGTGIIHQVNLEYLAQGVVVRQNGAKSVAFPDTLVGTDSHTTMINALGIVGWGVGGIEAEAVMLGQPISFVLPEVIGVELIGKLQPGVTATDLVLTITQLLRKEGVVGKFVEYFGDGVRTMSLPDRAVVANMAPEYGATMGFFAVDENTLEYYRQTGRSAQQVELIELYCRQQKLFAEPGAPTPHYTKVLRVNLAEVEPSVAGPRRPQDRISLRGLKSSFREALQRPTSEGGFGVPETEREKKVSIEISGQLAQLGHGSLAIAAITSCTNTSNPALMLAAGLLARKAVERGLRVPPFVKTSLAPGSRVVTEYLARTGLLEPLEKLGFAVVGYGCTTCIGNSGPLPQEVTKAVSENQLVVAAVLSGNRNFEGRINPHVRANYLASPPLVVAFALAGRVDIDFESEPLGVDPQGNPVFLRDIWPDQEEIEKLLQQALLQEQFQRVYANVGTTDERWQKLEAPEGELYPWDPNSTYIQKPPFFRGMRLEPQPIKPIISGRVLVALGDSVTTDHISPAGAIPPDSPAGKYLIERGVPPEQFNSYGSRRGNDQVMTRGTFANIRLRNLLLPDKEGGLTLHFTSGAIMTIYDAAMLYTAQGTPLLVLAGKEYGTGSSRDWAAKGTRLLGVKAVIAESFERIHRSNLIGMGVLPLELPPGKSWRSLGLTGEEYYDIPELNDSLQPRQQLTVFATRPDWSSVRFTVTARIDTPLELEYFRHGGILPYVLRKLIKGSTGATSGDQSEEKPQ